MVWFENHVTINCPQAESGRAVLSNGCEINTGILHTSDKCRGCNKCLNGCPVPGANVAVDERGINKIYVDQRRCILCGRCMDTCTHEARVFEDDTKRFFSDLATKPNKKISLILAPSFVINYPQKYKMILGYLKHLGVNHIYSASLGADISVWGYIRHMKENRQAGMLAQPCPSIVTCVEKHHPKLIDRLMPVQSPIMCLAIYLRSYMGLTDDLAFIGPCIAKKAEIEREENQGLIQYSVTFTHLLEALKNIAIDQYQAEDSELDYSMGAVFPGRGGLRKNLEYYLGQSAEQYINQKEGESYAYSYLDLYSAKVDYNDPYRAKLIDILNCSRGCNYGTGTEFKYASSNHIPYFMNRMQVEKLQLGWEKTPEERLEELEERFAGLNPKDFAAVYRDRSGEMPETTVTKDILEEGFRRLCKDTEMERTVDCSACGFDSCRSMAAAVMLGTNYRENCVQYLKKKLLEQGSGPAAGFDALGQKELPGPDRERSIDHLTGLLNRYGFEKSVDKALKNARREDYTSYVFVLDLDDFITVNDGYGIEFGNLMLAEVGCYLREAHGKLGEVFRLAGDEFALLVEAIDEPAARAIADEMIARTQRPWVVAEKKLYCTASIGIVRFPEVDDRVSDIIRHTELAMYKAKQMGSNTCILYDHEADRDLHDKVVLIRQMRNAISAGFEGFEVYYQPWVTPEGEIVGSEALLRWTDAQGNKVPPAEFIPVAEQIGMIVPLGDFVLEQAARHCREVNRLAPQYVVSVNVSAVQFNRAGAQERFCRILEEAGVDMGNVYLEITESFHLDEGSAREEMFRQLREKGIRIALDDFGTGYSTLNSLQELPLDLVKIDRSLVKNLETGSHDRYILSVITDLMHNIGRRICVEGIETKEQMEICRSYGVDIIQGFYFYRPMPFDVLWRLLREKERLRGHGARRPFP